MRPARLISIKKKDKKLGYHLCTRSTFIMRLSNLQLIQSIRVIQVLFFVNVWFLTACLILGTHRTYGIHRTDSKVLKTFFFLSSCHNKMVTGFKSPFAKDTACVMGNSLPIGSPIIVFSELRLKTAKTRINMSNMV